MTRHGHADGTKAAIARGFREVGAASRMFCGHLLIDGVFAACFEKMLA